MGIEFPSLAPTSGPRQTTSTVKDALQQATVILRATADTPRLEAEVLLGYTLDVSRTALLTHPERPVARHQLAHYQNAVRRRSAGYPLPYLTGRVEFYGLTFDVTQEVLIPRPETETLVTLALARRPATIVDVGTGSGCIAVSLAVHLSEAALYAIEISPAALRVAQRNAQRHGVAQRVRTLVGDVLSPRPGPVDLIVSNPPYVPSGECGLLPASVRDYEPRLALDGGPDGLVMVRQLLEQAPAVLKPGGAMLIEIGADQGEAAQHLACTFFPHAAVHVHPDLAGRDRVLEVQT
ncbi:MAG TPA: peptide chain release factor N(5)-glutamine methyltransferase [Chloroflexi bacterium]|nr:peptide chain release factor N(5)-glutamine methyltransferase [Chloroflexota bacterium]